MKILLPTADGVAETVAQRLPEAEIACYGEVGDGKLDDIGFYCLPYMGDAASLDLIRTLPALRVVQSLSSGVDDVVSLIPSGVTLCNGRGLHHEESAAELAVALMLASCRCLPTFVEQQRRRMWQHLRTESLTGKRVLLVGYGAIGRAIEERLGPFGVQVVRVSRTEREGVAGFARLPQLASSADILTVCIALSDETRGLVDAHVLASLPDGALVVNVARGPVVDSGALLNELNSGRLRAALDVTEPEPLPPGRPEWEMTNALITPHIGGDTTEFARRAATFVTDQVARYLSDHPLANVVFTASDGAGGA